VLVLLDSDRGVSHDVKLDGLVKSPRRFFRIYTCRPESRFYLVIPRQELSGSRQDLHRLFGEIPSAWR